MPRRSGACALEQPTVDRSTRARGSEVPTLPLTVSLKEEGARETDHTRIIEGIKASTPPKRTSERRTTNVKAGSRPPLYATLAGSAAAASCQSGRERAGQHAATGTGKPAAAGRSGALTGEPDRRKSSRSARRLQVERHLMPSPALLIHPPVEGRCEVVASVGRSLSPEFR